MISIVPRIAHVFLASAVALGTLAATAALADPPAPKPMPIKGESQDVDHKDWVAPQPATCPAAAAAPTNLASDPEEGGQASKTATATNIQPANVASDPEEGGQVRAAKTKRTKPTVSDINVMKTSDKASANLAPAPSAGPSCQ